MREPTILFGIGAAKAGTSWLYNYLRSHPDCHFRTLKELHYFDVIHGGGNWLLKSRQRRLAAIKQKLANNSRPGKESDLLLYKAEIEEWNGVFDGKRANDAGYVGFLAKGAGQAGLVGDITPAYATLDDKGFQHMASVSEHSKFILLLRDPLDRMWSNARMSGQRRARRVGGTARDAARREVEAFVQGKDTGLASRSDYQGTITRLLQVVPRARVLFEFFERLFTPAAVTRITDFLGIRARDGEFGEIRNKGRAMEMPADLRQRALVALAPQYNFIGSMFGDDVPAKWRDHHGQLAMTGY